MGDGDMQREAPTHRVADVAGSLTDLGDEVGGARQIDAHRMRATVAGRIDGHDFVVAGEVVDERRP